jgi:hypothetical protein
MPAVLYQRTVTVAMGEASAQRFTVSVFGSLRGDPPFAALIWSGPGIQRVVLANGPLNRIIEMAMEMDIRKLMDMADKTLAPSPGLAPIPAGRIHATGIVH